MSTRLLLLALVFVLPGCQKINEGDQQAALDCVKTNLAAMQKGDVDAVLATIHPKSPAFLSTPELISGIIQKYKLTYQLEEASVEQVTTEGIRVRFLQVTKKIEGPNDFPDNRVEGMHLLKRDGKAWKIWFTQVRQARTLDGLPLPPVRAVDEDPTPPPAKEQPTVPAAPATVPTDSQSAAPPATPQ